MGVAHRHSGARRDSALRWPRTGDYNVITMKTELIRIGNSRGVRIPKPLIEQVGLGDVVDLRVENDRLVLSPERRLRHGWSDAFRAAQQEKPEELLLGDIPPNAFDLKEWQW